MAIGAARISGQGVATTSTARARTGSPESSQASPAIAERQRHEEQRVAVGQAHERRLGRLASATRRTIPA